MWLIAGLAGLACVLTGAVSPTGAEDVGERALPVLGFLVAATVLAELADRAGVFELAAGGCARLAGGSVRRLTVLVAVLATATTVVLSLDTTAVLLTPVVLRLARRSGTAPLPLALLVVWLANTASLLLPVSNLTNLLAIERHRDTLPPAVFAHRMALPEVAAVAVTVGWIWLLHRRQLRGRFATAPGAPVPDRALAGVAGAACLALGPAVLLGVPAWAAATVAATACGLAAAVRLPRQLRGLLLPWRLVVLTLGLFLSIAALGEHGLTAALARLGDGSPVALLVLGAVGANLGTNLPAYLALEPLAHTPDAVLALLVGTGAGAVVTPWASLATLLWWQRCRAEGVTISPGRFVLYGLGGAPLVLAAAGLALLLTG